MNGLTKCLIYMSAAGPTGFLAGRALPKRWLDYDAPPFRELPFEQGGHFYRKLGIHRWHNRLPDMSRILPWTMPPKRVTGHITSAQAEVMVQETCVAEVTHFLLILAGLYMPFLWPGPGGWLCCLVFALANLPFILIQRFNRPKLRMLLEKCRQAEARKARRMAAD